MALGWVSGYSVYASERAKRLRQIDQARRSECLSLVHLFTVAYTYLGPHQPSFEGVEDLIDRGATRGEVIKFLESRLYSPGSVTLGGTPVGGEWFDVFVPQSLRDKHVYVVGKSGYGKTTLLRGLIADDLAHGMGIGVLAPEFEMISEDILPTIPEKRIRDVIYFNPEDLACPVVLNPLHLFPGDDIDIQADETFTILQRVVGDGGPRMDEILRHSLYALLERPGSTLLDFDRLLDREDPTLRRTVIERTRDEQTRRFFSHTYLQMPGDAHLPIMNRIGKITRSKFVRNCLCPPEDSTLDRNEALSRLLNIRAAMDQGKILLFNLSDGKLGEAASQLVGQLVVSKFQTATMSRADVPSHKRRPFYLYLDEFQNFCGTASKSYEKILSRARKYRLGLILAHQQTGQLPVELVREILGNVSTVVSFQLSPDDASRFSKIFDSHASQGDLQKLGVGNTVCRIAESVLRVWVDKPEDRGSSDVARKVMEHSRAAYGIPRKQRRSPTQGDKHGRDPLEGIDPGEVL